MEVSSSSSIFGVYEGLEGVMIEFIGGLILGAAIATGAALVGWYLGSK